MILDDTIVAVSTPPGAGARAIVRISGPLALEVAGRLTPGQTPPESLGGFCWADRVLTVAPLGELPARVYVFRRPRSYTTQDLVELHVPGSPVVTQAVLAACLEMGCRLAGGGEFTARAFLGGRLSLEQAQAVAGLIDADSERALRLSRAYANGETVNLARRIASGLTETLAGVEASIDLADEGIQPDKPADVADRLEAIARELDQLASRAAAVPPQPLPRVVLAGPPNAGKSSLLNALAGSDRAIVSPAPGTTRDVLDARATIEGRPVLLQDAAGLPAPPEGDVEALLAAQASKDAIAAADVLVLVRAWDQANAGVEQQITSLNPCVPRVRVRSKCDLVSGCDDTGEIATSARTGQGLGDLRRALLQAIDAKPRQDILALLADQRRHAAQAAQAAARARELVAASAQLADKAELVASEIRAALGELEHVCPTAGSLSDEVLSRMFARFCAGK